VKTSFQFSVFSFQPNGSKPGMEAKAESLKLKLETENRKLRTDA